MNRINFFSIIILNMIEKNNPSINSGIGIERENEVDPPYVNDDSTKKNHWGLGIEHEFLPIIKIKSGDNVVKIIKDLYYLGKDKSKLSLSKDELKNIEDIKVVVDKLLSDNRPVYFYCNFNPKINKYETEYPFSNIEWTGHNYFYMLETKNLDFQNKKLDAVYDELKKNTNKIMLDLNETIKRDSKLDLDFSIPNEGSIMFLTNIKQNMNNSNINNDAIFHIKGYNIDDYKVFTDTAGSYHFWMTLPYTNSQTDEHIMINHQKACYLLQTIEPLLVAIYGSPDPRYKSTNSKIKYFAGSYRGAVNRFANYGSSQINKYKTNLYTRASESSMISRPTSINSSHYITKIRDNYKFKSKKEKNDTKKKIKIIDEDKFINNSNSVIKSEKTPNYLFFDKQWKNFDSDLKPDLSIFNLMYYGTQNLAQPYIGLNIRRKDDIKGFEFRIMDHLPEEEIYDVFKIILLISCLSYEIDHKHLILSSTNNGWNDMMANALMYGSMKEVNKDYLTFISSQFKISTDIFKNKDPIKVLESLINQIWKIISKNKSNGYWLMCDDKKPIIKSKNKEILDKILNKNKNTFSKITFSKKVISKISKKSKKSKKVKSKKVKSKKSKKVKN